MLQDPSGGRIPLKHGDLSAMLRVLAPLNPTPADPVRGRRQLIADLCRFIGVQVGALSPELLGFTGAPPAEILATGAPPSPGNASNQASLALVPAPPLKMDVPEVPLSPRLEQTLRLLLEGHSEKQVARLLKISPHTVHAYVKEIYKRFKVSSRAELLSLHVSPAVTGRSRKS